MTDLQLDLSDGRSYNVTLGEVISDGGEGWIRGIVGLDSYCAKIYRRPEAHPRLEDRLDILSRFGLGEWHVNRHPELAFPVGLCRDEQGRCIGFAMHKLSWPPQLPLVRVLQPTAAPRKKGFLTWEHCVHFAADVARVVGKLHEQGIIVGDLCLDNIFVSLADARITLVDVDSFQVSGPDGTRHPTPVLRTDYSAPELIGRSAPTWRSPSSDLTPLGIVIAQILLDGVHPFSGYPLRESPPDGDDLDAYCIAAGLSWITNPDLVDPPKNAPDAASILPPGLVELMLLCFSDGASELERRPCPEAWIRELSQLAAGLQTCSENPRHSFRGDTTDCPWCNRTQIVGRDPFPEPPQPVPMPLWWLTRSAPATNRGPVDEERAWATIEKIKADDGVVVGTVVEVVNGGLILDIGLRGFLPTSLINLRRVRNRKTYVGKSLTAKIIELDKTQKKLVLSRRAWLEETQSAARRTLLQQLQKGQVRCGTVSSVVAFGAFVDLGGVDGLVHVSELSWTHFDHPNDVVELGQEVTVQILDVDPVRGRVSLSLKAMQQDPWQQFNPARAIGQIVPGTVTRLASFGAFVRDDHGIEGLVHISELAEHRVDSPEEVVRVGDRIFVMIVAVDAARRRISLSLKHADASVSSTGSEFDPLRYGMVEEYDEQGNYIYPDGFDVRTGEWLPDCQRQREEWERQYAEAYARWEAHHAHHAHRLQAWQNQPRPEAQVG